MAVAAAGPGCRALAALALLVLAGCSTGGKGPLADTTPTDREFIAAAVTWDLNKDGDVTCEEWKQYATFLFREADANRDGVLSREEFAAMSRRDRLFELVGFAYFDGNGDGRIALAELTDKPNPAFTFLDLNKDCVLAPEERRHQRAPSPKAETSDAQPPAAPPRPGTTRR